MKKRTLLMIILICIILIQKNALAATTQLKIDSAQASVGQQVSVAVNLNNQGNSICAIQFVVSYDSALIKLDSVSSGTLLSGNIAPSINSANEGKINFAWDTLNAVSGSGVLLVMNFTIKEGASGLAEIAVDESTSVIIADMELNTIEYDIKNGGINISSAPSNNPDSTKPSEKVNETNEKSVKVKPGTELKLKISSEAKNYSDEELIWTSSNEGVVKINESGKPASVGEGSAVVSLMSRDGTYNQNFNVSVGDYTQPDLKLPYIIGAAALVVGLIAGAVLKTAKNKKGNRSRRGKRGRRKRS